MGVYRVETGDPGCSDCRHGQTFDVIGPDDVAHSVSFGDEEEAQATARGFDHAYELGLAAGKVLGAQDPWTPFAEGSMPPSEGCSLLVWDNQFNSLTSTYWLDSIHNLETAKQFQWSHWMLAETVMRPRGLPPKEPPPVLEPPPPAPPTDAQIADEALRTVHGKTYDESSTWDDDIPF